MTKNLMIYTGTSKTTKKVQNIKKNPGKAAVVSVSLVLGIRAGAAFPGLDAVLLGSHPHWLTHSALPVWGLKKASEKFDNYLKKQEELIARGELDEAAEQRVQRPGRVQDVLPDVGHRQRAEDDRQEEHRPQQVAGAHDVGKHRMLGIRLIVRGRGSAGENYREARDPEH